MLEAKLIFEKCSSLVRVTIPDYDDGMITVCGDTHGQFFDLLKIFELNGKPNSNHYYVIKYY